MRVRKRDGSPFFYADFQTPSGRRRVSTQERTRKGAVKRAVALVEESSRVPEARIIDLQGAYASYVERCRSAGLTTAADYERVSRKTLGPSPGRFSLPRDLPVASLSGQHLASLRAARAAEGNAPGTIANELKILRAVVRHAVEHLDAQPPRIVSWDVPKTPRRLRYLTREEAAKLLAHLDPERPVQTGRWRTICRPSERLQNQRQDVRDLVVLLLLTGARWHEMAALTWRQVDTAIRLWSQKTDAERTVPLVGEAQQVIARRRAQSSGELVFPGVDGEERSGPCRAIYRAIDEAGLNAPAVVKQYGRATVHTLRHTYASWLRQAGLGLDEIQPLLGHATIAQTQVYAKIVETKALERAAQALSQP